MKFKLIETYLFEDIAAVKRQYSYIPEEDFDKIIRLDPTFNENRDSVGKYGKWLLGLYKKDNPLNNGNVTDIIQQYDKLKNDNSKKIEKDINKFKSLKDMYTAIQSTEEIELSDRQKLRKRQKNKDYDIVWQNDNWAIFVPNTWEAAVNLGKGTSWCTADSREDVGKEYYYKYLKKGGKYYIIINKHDKAEKYQFHFESQQFMDDYDGRVDLKEFFADDSTKGMDDFFKQEGYDTDYYASLFFNDWEALIDKVTNFKRDYRVNINNKIASVLLFEDEDWWPLFALNNALQGYYSAEELADKLFEYFDTSIINMFSNLYKKYNKSISSELEDDWDAFEDFIVKVSSVIEYTLADFNLRELIGQSELQDYFSISANNLIQITIDENTLRNKLAEYYDIYAIHGGDVDTVFNNMVLTAKEENFPEEDFPELDSTQALILALIGPYKLKCRCRSLVEKAVTQLLYNLTIEYFDDMTEAIKDYLE